MKATFYGHVRAVRALLLMEAKLEEKTFHVGRQIIMMTHRLEVFIQLILICPLAQMGETAVMIACGEGHLEVVQVLIGAGAAVSVRNYVSSVLV